MIIGIPKEIKNQEYRVGLTPSQIEVLVQHGHEVIVEKNAGYGAGFLDFEYEEAGAKIVTEAQDVFDLAFMIVKVKEPQLEEIAMLRADQLLFTYLHLAPDRPQTDALLDSGAIAIAYETVMDSEGKLPLLAPMSEVAGRMSIQAAAHHLEKKQGGRGVLMGGIPGTPAAVVLILGAGIVGSNALQMALGLGARTIVVDQNINRLRELDWMYGNRIQTFVSNDVLLSELYCEVDVVIGSVLIPGGAAPKLLRTEQLCTMQEGAVIVDVAIDQGGCFETSTPTTHDNPTFVKDGIIHYCVANMPGAVPRTSTIGLTNSTFPYILAIANRGLKQAIKKYPGLAYGINTMNHALTNEAVAESQDRKYTSVRSLLK